MPSLRRRLRLAHRRCPVAIAARVGSPPRARDVQGASYAAARERTQAVVGDGGAQAHVEVCLGALSFNLTL